MILTGTPVQNSVNEVWAAFDFLMPNFLGTSDSFSKNFARPIMNSQLQGASASVVNEGMMKLKLLHQQVLPFILRREKEQVLRELPPKNLITVTVPLSDLQRQIYKDFSLTSNARESLAALEGFIGNSLSSESLGMGVLKTLLFLRLLCTHPSLILSPQQQLIERYRPWQRLEASGKMMALVQLLSEAGIYKDSVTAADNDASLLYCDEEETTADSYQEVITFQDDIVPSSFNKTKAATKCLIFSQFTRTLDLVEELIFKQKMPSLRYLRMDGRVPPEKRSILAETFNHDDALSVMLLTTRVGGLGLNLTGKYENDCKYLLKSRILIHTRRQYGYLARVRLQSICRYSGKFQLSSDRRSKMDKSYSLCFKRLWIVRIG